MAVRIGWRQELAWRMHRQLLDPVRKEPVEAIVSRLCGVQAQVASSAELAVRVRMADSGRRWSGCPGSSVVRYGSRSG